jgi:hypothetical protein
VKNKLVLLIVYICCCSVPFSFIQSCEIGDHEEANHYYNPPNPPSPPKPPATPPPSLGTYWAETESPIGHIEWEPNGEAIVFLGVKSNVGATINYLSSELNTVELLDYPTGTIVDFAQGTDRAIYYLHYLNYESQTISKIDPSTKQSKIIIENLPYASSGPYEEINKLEVSPNNRFLYVDLVSGSMTIDLESLAIKTWSSIVGHFSMDEMDELVLLLGDLDSGWTWRFVNMGLETYQDKEHISFFPDVSDVHEIIDFSWSSEEMNIRWKRPWDNNAPWPYYSERIFSSSDSEQPYYTHIEYSPGGSEYYNNHFFSKSLNKCVEISHVIPGTAYERQIILRDFKRGTVKILADKVPMNWYKYNNFSFSDDETKVAFTLSDVSINPNSHSIFWMRIE